ncbi:MAG: 30S ribosomal protein S16 [Raineya sp.]
MAVKIRLARRGKKKYAMYDVVVADSRSPRDGRFIEKIGTYNPNTNPATINLNEAKAFEWVMNGAVPTDTVKAMLSYRGILFKKHLQVGVLKGAITQEQADAKLAAWKENKMNKIQGKVDRLSKAKQDAQKARLQAEAKVKEDRARAIAEKQKVKETPTENTDNQEVSNPEQNAE